MEISEKKMQIVINNYFEQECDVNTSIREAFEKGFRIGVKKILFAQPKEDIRAMCGECDAWNQYKNYSQPGWIPCSEQLPKKPNIYTVTDSKGDVVRFIFTGTESSREYWRRCAKAWMPLTQPYQEGGQDTDGET